MDIAEIQNRVADLVADADAREHWHKRLAEYDAACQQAYGTTTDPPAEDSEDIPDGWPDAWQPWTEGHGESKRTVWRRRGPNDKIDQYVRECREKGPGWSFVDAMTDTGHPEPRPADDRERLLIAYAALTALHDQRTDYLSIAEDDWNWGPTDLEPLTTTDDGQNKLQSWLDAVERDITANTLPSEEDDADGDELTDPMACVEVVRLIGHAAGRSDALARKMQRRGCHGKKVSGKWYFEREDFKRLFPKHGRKLEDFSEAD